MSGTQLKVGVIYVLENAFDLYIVSLEKEKKEKRQEKMTGKVKDEDELQEQVSCQRRATEESIR